MIRHIVMFSAKDPKDAAFIRDSLAKMADIPGSTYFEVKMNDKRDSLSKEIDVVLYSEFPSYEALDAYQAHPAYAESTRVVRPLRDQRIVVDFESD